MLQLGFRRGVAHSAQQILAFSYCALALIGCGAGDEASGDARLEGGGGEAGAESGQGAALKAELPTGPVNSPARGADALPRSSAEAGEPASPTPSGADEDSPGAGDTPSSTMPPACIPTNDVDVPDDDFEDTNCDGIDGDLENALFVSPDGLDNMPGTLNAPVQTLGRAVELATQLGRAVYVCNGTYRETLSISAPVSIYGGYDCAYGWRRIKDRAVVESGVGVQLSVRGVTGLVHIERMAFRALDAGAGQSSQAAAIVASNNVALVRTEFLTGDGAPGLDGVAGTPGSNTAPPGANGSDSAVERCYGNAPAPGPGCDSYAGGAPALADQVCFGGTVRTTHGGSGGGGGNTYLARGRPGCLTPAWSLGHAGSAGQYLSSSGWRDVAVTDLGRRGVDGADGTPAALGIGSVQGGVYVATNSGTTGRDGTDGKPGAGGRGGDSDGGGGDICLPGFSPGSGGGQGGGGGCAGTAATHGYGGGGSIGLVIIDSSVSLSLPRFAIGHGGEGGDGAPGGDGKPGAAPGAPGAAFTPSNTGEPGQPGGDGGDGGDGGPGGGGPSIAILYVGTAPEVADAVYDIAPPGQGGLGLSLGNAASGVTGEVVSLTEASR